MESLDGARLVMHDPEWDLALAWFGGHGIHAYDVDGTEVSYWSVGDFANDDATAAEVEASMRECIETGDYA
jgi:hypothetical protein